MTERAVKTFQPQLWDEPGVGWCYEDGFVTASVSVSVSQEGVTPKAIGILEWSSDETGKGHTTRALRWLRQQGFERIEAIGVGMLGDVDGELVGDIATYYWARMHAKGLCDALYDDEGQEIEVIHGDQSVGPELRYKSESHQMTLPELCMLMRLNDKELNTSSSSAAFLGQLTPSDRGSVLILWCAKSHSLQELKNALQSWTEEDQDRRVEVLSLSMNLACDHNDLILGRSSAAANRHMTDICEVLLQEGANPCLPGEDGLATLHRATLNENTHLMRFMLAVGCPVDQLSNRGYTALGHAVESSAFTAAQLLLRSGADPNARPMSQSEPHEDRMDLCEISQYKMSSSMTWLLIAYGAQKNGLMIAREPLLHATPEYAAIQAGDTDRLLSLFEAGGADALRQVPLLRQSVIDGMFSMDDVHEQASREILSLLDAYSAKSVMESIEDRSRSHRHSP